MIMETRISIQQHPGTVTIASGDTVLAESAHAVILHEQGYPSRTYFPAADVRIERLQASETETYCPFKGHAEYFHAEAGDKTLTDIAWSYPEPIEGVAEISGHIAFYEEKLSVSIDD